MVALFIRRIEYNYFCVESSILNESDAALRSNVLVQFPLCAYFNI
jgi:hypothetical protein